MLPPQTKRNLVRKTRRQAYKLMSTLSFLAIACRIIDSSSVYGHFLQGAIWVVFAFYTIGYVHIAHPGRSWWRHHIADMVITLTWNPLVLSYTLGTHQLVPVVLQLSGLIAHAFCASRAVRFRWGKHPFIASIFGLMAEMCLASALLHRLEEDTFHSFWTAMWFSFETVTTLGFGELVPHTVAARTVTIILSVSGSGLLGLLSTYLAVNILESVHWNPSRRLDRSVSGPDNVAILAEIKAITAQLSLLHSKVDSLELAVKAATTTTTTSVNSSAPAGFVASSAPNPNLPIDTNQANSSNP